MERIDNCELVFHWVSQTEQAACPRCKSVSYHRVKIYATRRIQDLPTSGMTVYHKLQRMARGMLKPDPEFAGMGLYDETM